MVDPVTAADGMTYERVEIEKWLDDHDNSPCSAELPNRILHPNQALKSASATGKTRAQEVHGAGEQRRRRRQWSAEHGRH